MATQTDFLNSEELQALQLAGCGKNVLISRRALILGASRIHIGDHTRIDAFCIVAAGERIDIGAYIHISAYTSFQGSKAITLEDYCTVSSKVSVFSSNDDYSGACMTNATIPAPYRHTLDAPVTIKSHAIIGCGAIILPGVTVGNSASVGALSLVKKDVPEFAVVGGVPAKVIGKRSKQHLEIFPKFIENIGR